MKIWYACIVEKWLFQKNIWTGLLLHGGVLEKMLSQRALFSIQKHVKNVEIDL